MMTQIELFATKPELPTVSALLIALFFIATVVGCERKSGGAVVIGKEHIAAAPATTERPNTQSAASPNEELRTIADDEITVDGYVMKREARGTSRDPRALKAEQWLVKVRVISDARTFNVQAEQARFNKLNEGDRVKLKYRVGKYTGTVWAAEIE